MAEKTSHVETRTRGEGSFFHKPSKKTIFGSAAVLLLAILIFGAVSTGLPERFHTAKKRRDPTNNRNGRHSGIP